MKYPEKFERGKKYKFSKERFLKEVVKEEWMEEYAEYLDGKYVCLYWEKETDYFDEEYGYIGDNDIEPWMCIEVE